MSELTKSVSVVCPHCNQSFDLNASQWDEVARQVRDESFNQQVKERLAAQEEQLKKTYNAKLESEMSKLKAEQQKADSKNNESINQLKMTISGLQKDIDTAEKDKQAALAEQEARQKESENKLKFENQKLQNQVDSAKIAEELALKKEAEKHLDELNFKDKQISELQGKVEALEQYKIEQSNKVLGEKLETWCYDQYIANCQLLGRNSELTKDGKPVKGIDALGNEEEKGTKGDFIFRSYADDGTELLSIMFDMKDEFDNSVKKKKNADHLEKLHEDRVKKNCEYAILVSTLEKESDYYNQGIVDVSNLARHEKIFVVRPNFFIPVLLFLDKMALDNAEDKKKLAAQKRENIDIAAFLDNVEAVSNTFNNHYRHAINNHNKALDKIDEAIETLQKVKEFFQTSNNQLSQGAGNLKSLNAKGLTKNNPTMKKMFEEAEARRQLPESTGQPESEQD